MRRSLFWLLYQYPETGECVASVHETALEHAAEADRLGFTSLWLAEHHFVNLGTAPNPAVLLAAIAP
ncbi:MAG: LLM class flavin-dependent oxidoreductase [bacterium]|nr:LLM class flavin-dependent oxidoreductase [bacterium]